MIGRHFSGVFLVLLFMMGSWREAKGQPLADLIPSDAVLYLGWKGVDELGEDYAGSNLAGFSKAFQGRALIKKVFDGALKKFGGELPPQFGVVMNAVGRVMDYSWRRPMAIYVGLPKNVNNPPSFVLLWDAAKQAEALTLDLEGLLQLAGADSKDWIRVVDKRFVLLGLGVNEGGVFKLIQTLTGKNNKTLFRDARFKASLEGGVKRPALVGYLDIEKGVKFYDRFAAAGDDLDTKMWPPIRDALRLDGFRQIVWTSGFSGKSWVSRSSVMLKGKKTGLLKIWDDAPLGQDVYKLIPRSATWANVSQFDVNAVYVEIRDRIFKAFPDLKEGYEIGLEEVKEQIGLDLEKDIIDAIGSIWTVYRTPEMKSGWRQQMIVHRPRDAKKTAKMMDMLTQLMNFGAEGAVKVTREQHGDAVITSLVVDGEPLAWTVADGYLYFGSKVAHLKSAIKHAREGRTNIKDNAKFVAVMRGLGVGRPTSFVYVDAPKELNRVFSDWRELLDQFELDEFKKLVPKAENLAKYFEASGRAAWVDSKGWHSRATSSFPGAELFSSQGPLDLATSAVTPTAVAISVLLPSLGNANEAVNRTVCASNMKSIGTIMSVYSADNNGKLPDSLVDMAAGKFASPKIFLCPSVTGRKQEAILKAFPKNRMDRMGIAAWLEKHCNFVYLGKGKKWDGDTNVILMYEKLGRHNQEGINILFGDGSARWVPMNQARRLLLKAGVKLPI